MSDILIKSANSFPSIILTGARQTGKTHLLKKIFKNYTYVSLDLPSNAYLAENDPKEFLKQFNPPVIIDEVQYAPKVFRHLKIEIDANRNKYGMFILSGSQKFNLMKNVSESLAGRCAILELETLAYSEIKSQTNYSFVDAMFLGGFPELISRNDLDRNLFFHSYVATYLERDVKAILNIGALRDFERFLKISALRSANIVNKSELARDVGISHTTSNEWLSVASTSNQILLLEPWFTNRTKALIKSPKLFLADTGILNYLLNIDSVDEMLKSPLIGAIFETYVFSEIRKYKMFRNENCNLFFWRDKYGLETDFLIHKGGKFKLFECKFSEIPRLEDAKKLIQIAEIIGRKDIEFIGIISRSNKAYPINENVYSVPVELINEYI